MMPSAFAYFSTFRQALITSLRKPVGCSST